MLAPRVLVPLGMRASTTMMTLPRANKRRALAATDPIANQPVAPRGSHKIVAPIAMGGMSGVYLAEDTGGKRVALKVLDPKFSNKRDVVARFAAEREVSRRVGHTGLIRIHSYEKTAEQAPYLVMELIDGENLGSTVDRSGPLLPGAVASIGAQLADALAALHAGQIVHCDVKPENVMILYARGLAGWPRVKLGDFGVARFLDSDSDEQVAGTPAYMAPEQWRGDIGPATDIYGLGCTLYELATGNPPFDGTVPELAQLHMHALPKRPSEVRAAIPASLDTILMRMIRKDPAMRGRAIEHARELADLAYSMPAAAAGFDSLTRVA